MLASTTLQSIHVSLAAFASCPNLCTLTATRAARNIELAYIAKGDPLVLLTFRARHPACAHLAAALGATAAVARQ